MSAEGTALRPCPSPGDVLGGKYKVARIIGEGGMGMVFEAEHQRLGQTVAIKVLRAQERQVPELVARFEREARTAAKLCGPNVARVTDVDLLPDGTPYMVMEYLEGHDLDTEIVARGRLPVEEAVGYVLQACSAVAEAHALGIVHRDLKPHNLFLTGDQPNRRIKLLDFGISKPSTEADMSVTVTRSSLGTPLYMSPEQIRSAKRADKRSDIWSLGVILYELVTGKTPFEGESPSAVIAAITADTAVPPHELRPIVPRELSAAIMRALDKDAEHRHQSVVEFAEAIQPFGPQGAWTPAHLPSSSPSHPRISIVGLSDAPTLRADMTDPVLLDSLQASASPVSATSEATHERRRRTRSVVIGLAVLVTAGVVGAIALGSAEPSSRPATTTAAAAPTPTAEPAATAPRVAPVIEPAPPIETPSSTTADSPAPSVKGKRPKHSKPGAAPSKEGTASSATADKPAPAKPAANPDNPLHL